MDQTSVGSWWLPEEHDRRLFEHVAVDIMRLLPLALHERTRDTIVLTCAENLYEGLVVVLTPDGVECRLAYTDWVDPGLPVASSTFWRRMPLDDSMLEDYAWSDLFEEATKVRRGSYLRCVDCHRMFAPEHTTDVDGTTYCHGCAPRHGIVY